MKARIPSLPLLAGLACLLALTMTACGKAASHGGQFVVANPLAAHHYNWVIFGMDVKWGQPVALTDDNSNNMDPAWSSDGMKIVFVSDRDGRSELYSMRPDGSGQTRLTQSVMPKYKPQWSPDGKKIAFVDETSKVGNLYVVNADGSGMSKLAGTVFTAMPVSWSPDSRRLAFTRALEHGTELMIIESDVSGLQSLSGQEGQVMSFCFSPTGEQLFYSQLKPDRKVSQIFSVNAAGGPPTLLTPPDMGTVTSFWWTEGNRILFQATVDNRRGFYRMDADGKNLIQIADNLRILGRPIGPSPDGKTIAYIALVGSGADQRTEVQVMNIDGTKSRQVTQLGEFILYGEWSTDGKYIDIRSNLDKTLKPENYRNRIISLDGALQMEITDFAGFQQVMWRP